MTTERIESVMEQAQIFASSWALAGTRFAAEDQYETAMREKRVLEVMVNALAAPVAPAESVCARCGGIRCADPLLPAENVAPALVPLTDEQIRRLDWCADIGCHEDVVEIVRATEAAHGIKP